MLQSLHVAYLYLLGANSLPNTRPFDKVSNQKEACKSNVVGQKAAKPRSSMNVKIKLTCAATKVILKTSSRT